MPIDLGKPSRQYTQAELDNMKLHATGNTKIDPYVDHYKEGDYSNITTEIDKVTPKGDKNGFSEITARMGPYYCDEEDLKALEALQITLAPVAVKPDLAEALTKLRAETPPTRFQRFKAWLKRFLRLK